ncbi:MAG: OmpA family protein [Chlorobi bacterium]|nr:OmpA family protein [Chlorobiota bacterium]
MKILRNVLWMGILALTAGGCVSQKKYAELEEKYYTTRSELAELEEENDSLRSLVIGYESKWNRLKTDYDQLQQEYQNLQRLFKATETAYKNLQASYDALTRQSSAALEAQSVKMKELIRQLEEKEKKLAKERELLDKMQQDLAERSARIRELERLIAEKDSLLRTVKASLSASLDEFTQHGLKVHMKNGKLYVSMQNKLLFDSGSWHLKQGGMDAIDKIARVLAENPDLEIMIEGHTDNVPYRGNQYIEDNWDLSVKRATTVVRQLLKNKDIDPKRLIAAGRSKYHPVAPNDTPENRAKNRRIEVILTPNMDKIQALLQGEGEGSESE